jgi:hypothetical protein
MVMKVYSRRDFPWPAGQLSGEMCTALVAGALGARGMGARNFGCVFLAKGHGSLGASWIFYRFASLLEIGETEGRRAQELPVPPEVRVPEPYGCVGIRHRLDA